MNSEDFAPEHEKNGLALLRREKVVMDITRFLLRPGSAEEFANLNRLFTRSMEWYFPSYGRSCVPEKKTRSDGLEFGCTFYAVVETWPNCQDKKDFLESTKNARRELGENLDYLILKQTYQFIHPPECCLRNL